MEIKKSKKADLQSKKSIFIQLGFILSILIVWGIFNTSQGTISQKDDYTAPPQEIIQEIAPIVRNEEEKLQQTTKVVAPTISEIIQVVPNEVNIENSDIFNPEATEDMPVYYGLPEGTPKEGLIEEDIPVIKAEVEPDFQGAGPLSKDIFRKWVQSKVTYPAMAQDNNVTGAVVLKFVIGKDGMIRDVDVLASPHSSLTDEVVRVIKSSPMWTPGKQREKPVSVIGTIRIVFTN